MTTLGTAMRERLRSTHVRYRLARQDDVYMEKLLSKQVLESIESKLYRRLIRVVALKTDKKINDFFWGKYE